MGKKNFDSEIRSRFADGRGNFSCKVSYFSDTYDKSARFAGVIIYHFEDELEWVTPKGHNAKGCYAVIQDTSKWPDGVIHDRAGQGRVHDYLYKYITDVDFEVGPNAVCCGGFAVDRGTTKYSSVFLNDTNNYSCTYPWESDKKKYLSPSEIAIVDKVVREWKSRGKDTVVKF